MENTEKYFTTQSAPSKRQQQNDSQLLSCLFPAPVSCTPRRFLRHRRRVRVRARGVSRSDRRGRPQPDALYTLGPRGARQQPPAEEGPGRAGPAAFPGRGGPSPVPARARAPRRPGCSPGLSRGRAGPAPPLPPRDSSAAPPSARPPPLAFYFKRYQRT